MASVVTFIQKYRYKQFELLISTIAYNSW